MYVFLLSSTLSCKINYLHLHHNNKTNRYTAMTNEDYMNNELAALAAMTEEEACKVYNVDYKAEAEIYIRDYWMYIA